MLPSPFAALEAQLHVLDFTECNTYLCPVSTVPMIEKIHAERPAIQLLVVPSCEEWLDEEISEDYLYRKTFEEAKEDTFMIVHSSGTTGEYITWSNCRLLRSYRCAKVSGKDCRSRSVTQTVP